MAWNNAASRVETYEQWKVRRGITEKDERAFRKRQERRNGSPLFPGNTRFLPVVWAFQAASCVLAGFWILNPSFLIPWLLSLMGFVLFALLAIRR